MTTVLVADDDPHIRELVRLYLQREGLSVVEARDGSDARARLAADSVDMVVLDLMMPGVDGVTLCREIRSSDRELPILMLTARGETHDKVGGLASGADDYIVKPFDPDELIARVRALLRRARIAASQVVEVGAVRLDQRTRRVVVRDHVIDIPAREFELLYHLGSYPGRTLTRDHLIERIWGYDFEGDERTVDVHVKRLRDRFPEQVAGFRIRTVRGLGYRLEVGE